MVFWKPIVNQTPLLSLSHVYFLAGVIDQDYRGNVGVIMFNFGDQDFQGKTINTYQCWDLAKVQVN